MKLLKFKSKLADNSLAKGRIFDWYSMFMKRY